MVFGAVLPCDASICLLDSAVALAKRVPETLLSGALRPREMTSMDGESFLAAASRFFLQLLQAFFPPH